MDNKLTRLTLVMVFVIINLITALCSPSPFKTETVNGYVAADISGNDTQEIVTGTQTQSWDLLNVEAPQAWLTLETPKNVVVAVLDTGIDDSHLDLNGTVIGRVNFSNDVMTKNINAHGTFVAGIIAGLDNGYGVNGIAHGCSLLDVKVANNDGSTDAAKVAKGIIWAANNGANVINISVVITGEYPLLEYAVDYAWNKGCVIVASAGNNASSTPVYPAAYDNVIAVGASDRNDATARWSNHGDWVSVNAPGVDIYSTLPGDQYGYKNGSSFSTALVSGEAALLVKGGMDVNNNSLINDEILNNILNNCDTTQGPDGILKRINVNDAAKAAEIIGEMLAITSAINE